MRRILWWVIAGTALLFAAGAALFFQQGRDWHRRFDEWLVARPVDLEVDLSVPGTFSAPLLQTCSVAHAEVFELLTPDSPVTPDADVLEGLQGALRVTDADGREVTAETFPPSREVLGPRTEGLLLFRILPFPAGGYTVSLDVTSGAPALAGMRQRLVARYELCGMERLPGTIAYAFSAGFGLVGIVLGVILLATGLRARTPAPVPRAPASHPAGAGRSG